MADLANLRISVDSREVKKAATDLDQLNRSSTGAEQGASKASSAFRGLGAVLASLGIAAIARETILLADTYTRMSGQISLVTKSATELANVEANLFALSQRTRVGYETTVSLFTRLARSTESLGVSQQSVLRVTETINKAMIVSGASAEQSSGALMQLGQAFASGALRGDELNSVMESMPRVAQAIAEGMGISVGELKKLGEQGKLTSQAVYAALLKMSGDIDTEFAKMPMTVAQSLTVLSNSLLKFIGEADSALGITATLSSAIVSISNNFDEFVIYVQTAAIAVAAYYAAVIAASAYNAAMAASLLTAAGATGVLTTAMNFLNATLLRNPFVLFAVAIATVGYAFLQLRNDSKEAEDALRANAEIAKQSGFELNKQSQQALNAANEAAGLGVESKKTADHTFTFTKEIMNSSQALRDQAVAARTARIEILKTRLADSQKVEQSSLDTIISGKGLDPSAGYKAMASGDILGGLKTNAKNVVGIFRNLVDGGKAVKDATTNFNQAAENSIGIQKQLKDALSSPIGESDIPKQIALGDAIKKTGKAAKEAVDPLEKYRDALADMVVEGKKIGMTPEQAKAFDVEALADEAEAVAKANKLNIGTLADQIRQRGMLNALNQYAADIQKKVSDELKDYAKAIADNNKAHSDTMTKLRGEATLIGLVGVEREKATLKLEREAYVLKYGETAWKEYYAARLAGIDEQSVFDKDIEALQTLTNNLETAAGMIGGKGGRALQGALKMELVLADGTTEKLSQTLAKSFKGLSDILAQAVAGMQIGNLVGGMAGSKTGGTIGGGIGGALGKKLLTDNLAKIAPELGKFAGPLGALAGGLLGGVIGGLLKKTKTGSVTLNQIAGGAMERTLTGNSAKLKGIADNMANGLLKGIGNIAEQLGGALGGNVKVSLGMRKKDFVVDPTGAGRTKGAGVMNFGTDQAAAVAYVTQLAIQQGIVTGISAGAQTLIRAGNDLNEQVAKALKFDQVFKDLLSETDPLRASLDELSVEMEKLKVIFAEAGASAADYAKLEELYAIKQAKAAFEANRPRRELEIKLMEASGDAAGALAARRKDELAAMNESLRGLQLAIYTYEDLAAANDNVAFAQANLASAIEAQAQQARELQIAKMREEINGLEQIIAGREEAQRALRAAYDAEVSRIDGEIANRQKNIQSLESAFDAQASVMKGTIDKFRDFATSMREFASSIIPLNATGPSSISALRKKFAELAKLAIGGDTGAMGKVTDVGSQLREAITSGATDRVSMLRDLYALQFESEQVAAQAEAQASIAEQQLAILTAQYDAMISAEERAIAQFEADKAALAAQVEQFISLGDKVLTVDAAIKQLQTAEQAALEAEARKADLERQIEALSQVGIDVNEVEKAQRELEKAKAERDKIRDDINKSGFQSVVDAIKDTAASQAAAAQLAAQAQVVSVLPNNVIPFPIMGGGFGAGGGNREFGMNNNIRPFANGGIHSGGLRLVGENGPELEATGPSRIYNSNQLGNMLNHGAAADEVKALREEMKVAMYQIAKNTGKNYDLMNRWDGDGLPPERIVG